MTKLIEIAKQDLLDPAGLTDHQLQHVLSNVLGSTVDNADLYFQSSYSESWLLEDGIIKSGSYNIDRGVGVRAMSGEKTGFAYSDDILLPRWNKLRMLRAVLVKQAASRLYTMLLGHGGMNFICR